MADVEDVSQVLVTLIAGMLTGAGGVPLTGVQTDAFAGWPKPNDLNAAMTAGAIQVSIYPQAGSSTQVTRHQRQWERTGTSAITTTAVIAGGVITFGGSVTLPLNVAVAAQGRSTNYAAVAGETLASLAIAVAASCVAAGIGASASGATVILASGGPATITLGGEGTLIRENAREEQIFQITVWAPTQALRQATTKAFESQLAGTDVLNLPDGSQANIRYMKHMINDHSEVENLYRADIWYRIEYPVTETTPGWDIGTVSTPITEVFNLLNPPPVSNAPVF
jgi:hypothetical protein